VSRSIRRVDHFLSLASFCSALSRICCSNSAGVAVSAAGFFSVSLRAASGYRADAGNTDDGKQQVLMPTPA
jgi:hypothetical protein